MNRDGKQSSDIPPYIVPFSEQAQEAARYLIVQMKPAQKYLLAGRGDLKKRISENTLNTALRRMGYVGLLTGHGIRATISTALNEIGYPKIWVDAQLSHSDPDKVSASYNHAEYVGQRRSMMQDWADRLDLWERGLSEAASMPLSSAVQSDGMSVVSNMAKGEARDLAPATIAQQEPQLNPAPVAASIWLPAVSIQKIPTSAMPEPSPFQRAHAEKLELYEAPHNLTVIAFAKLAGKSRDQVNRDIKAGRLLTLTMGNRGQRIPDWQLDPLCQELTSRVLAEVRDMDSWKVYQALSTPLKRLGGLSLVESVATLGLDKAVRDAQRALVALAG